MKSLRLVLIFCFFVFLQHALPGSFIQSSQSTPKTYVDKDLVLELVNKHRINGYQSDYVSLPPAEPLIWDDTLALAAFNHCTDMYENNFHSHKGSEASLPGNRLKKLGYKCKTWGENIAKGYRMERNVINGWMLSYGHRSNIMTQKFRKIGVARVGNYWTMVLSD
jgi:uncharacterized protein YkwD